MRLPVRKRLRLLNLLKNGSILLPHFSKGRYRCPGGAVLSIVAQTGWPVKLAGVGEKVDQLEVFHPDRMASRIMGMGDFYPH